jgi:hypothetical protein
MQPTDTLLLREDFVRTIEAISPSFRLRQDARWAALDSLDHVEGAEARRFFIRMGFGEIVEDGIYGDGLESQTTIEVWTSYRGIQDAVVDSLATQDSNDLFLALEARVDPTLAGFLSIEPQGYRAQDEKEEGRVWGHHQFLVRYLAPS